MNWFKRCFDRRSGPFGTEWRCLLPRKHEGNHVYEPDLWTGRDYPEEVVAQAWQDRLADDARVERARKAGLAHE